MLFLERIKRGQSVRIWSLEKWGGGALSYEEFRNKYAELVVKQSQSLLLQNQDKSFEHFKNEIDELKKENQDNYKKMLEERHNKDE